MKKVSEIDFRAKQENKWEYEGLLTVINTKLERYIKESGENAYSLFNAITDLASNPNRAQSLLPQGYEFLTKIGWPLDEFISK